MSATLERAARHVQLLTDTVAAVSSSLDLAEVLAEIASRVAEAMATDACFVYLYDEASGMLELRATHGTRFDDPAHRPRMRRGEGITGVAAEEWLTGVDGWSDRVHPDDRERALRLYRQAISEGRPYRDEYRLVDGDGGERWFHDQSVIVRDERGLPVEIQGVIHEITDRKRAEQALHQSEWRLRVAEAR